MKFAINLFFFFFFFLGGGGGGGGDICVVHAGVAGGVEVMDLIAWECRLAPGLGQVLGGAVCRLVSEGVGPARRARPDDARPGPHTPAACQAPPAGGLFHPRSLSAPPAARYLPAIYLRCSPCYWRSRPWRPDPSVSSTDTARPMSR